MRRKLAWSLSLAAGTLVLAIVAMGEVPRWTTSGSRMVSHSALQSAGVFPIRMQAGSSIAVRGDSNVAANHIGGPDMGYPLLLANTLGQRVTAANLGFGGDTASMGLSRWNDAIRADLCILMYGTNDAAPRAALSDRSPVLLGQFEENLARTAEQCQAAGAQVLILAPPPVGSRAMERRIAPYRNAARQAAVRIGAHFLDPVAAFAPDYAEMTLLQRDAIHLNPSAQQLLAEWLAAHIVVETGGVHASSTTEGGPDDGRYH